MNIRQKLQIAAAAALVGGLGHAHAEVKLSGIFGSDMVLQQSADVEFRGTAAPGSKVTLDASWGKKKLATTAAVGDGAWTISVATPQAGGPYTITVADRDGAVSLTNVLVGDVWVCAGQSNMEMPLKGFRGQPTHDTHDLIATARPDAQLRLFQAPRDWSTTPKSEIGGGHWATTTPATAGAFSAVGYVFGEYLQKAIQIPVGMIQIAWSASKIQAWIPRSTFESAFPEVEMPQIDKTEFGWTAGTPTLLYNAMVEPWRGFPVKGVIWYQGEANNREADQYADLFAAMTADWRGVFANPELPIYFAELAPFTTDGTWADFRAVQHQISLSQPHTAMATLGDVGDPVFIHAPRKVPVGKRLAYLALEDTYGLEGIESRAPYATRCEKVPADSAAVVVYFDRAASGLTPENADLEGFEIVDASGVVHPTTGRIVNGSARVKVSTAGIKRPVEVRYAYKNLDTATLFSNLGLPAVPFKMELPREKKTAMMWFDGSANFERFSHPDSIDYYMDRVADLGFTHAVVCVRPISGEMMCRSALGKPYTGPKHNIHPDFDYLDRFIKAGHRRGVKVLASMNTFCSGNNFSREGLVYEDHPEWATMILHPERGIIPITELQDGVKYAGMVNPTNPEYQEYIINVMEEMIANYPDLDGLMLDRVRYDGIWADFSPMSRAQFEKYIGKKVKNFPADILTMTRTDNGGMKANRGPLFLKWIEWRSQNIRNFMEKARARVKAANPDVLFSTYTGAWYPTYYEVGVNFASKDYDPSADFDWATPEYGARTGYGELIDLYTTGNYYTDITIAESLKNENLIWNETDSEGHRSTWYSVQGSNEHLDGIMGSNEFVGGILADQFYGNPEGLARSIEMNLLSSDGVMIFDIVHIITKDMWKQVEDGMRRGGNLK